MTGIAFATCTLGLGVTNPYGIYELCKGDHQTTLLLLGYVRDWEKCAREDSWCLDCDKDMLE